MFKNGNVFKHSQYLDRFSKKCTGTLTSIKTLFSSPVRTCVLTFSITYRFGGPASSAEVRLVLVQDFIKTEGSASAIVYEQRQKKAKKCLNVLRMSLKSTRTNHLMWQRYEFVEPTD